MDFNFDTGAIYGGLQTLDVTTLPPFGGTVGVLTLLGDGAVDLLKGGTATRPSSPNSGMFRYNTDTDTLEYYNGVTWATLAVGGGTVTSVDAESDTPALTVTGGPITSAGTFTFDLDADLTAIAALSGTGFAVRSAADTWVQRSIAGTAGNIVVTDGDGVAGNPAIDLATVGTPVTASFVKITTDTFGRVSATTPVVQSDITTLVDSVYVNIAGDTMTGDLNMGGNSITNLDTPVNGGDAVNKDYADALANGLSWKQAVRAATTSDGDLATDFENGDSVDGYTLVTGDRILIKDQNADEENGIYIVQATGAPVRSTDMDSTTPINEINGAAVFVEQGTVNADTAWVQIADVQVLGTDPLVFTQFAGAGSYTAGNGLQLVGNQFSLISPVTVANGGTGLSTAPTNGQLLIGNGTGYTLATLTDGTAIDITEGAGTITITNTGVTSVAGTTNEVTVSASTGAVTIGLPDDVTVANTLTVSGLTPNGALYAGAAGLVSSTAALTDGQILIGDTGSAPVASTITGGTGITVTNGAGSITIDVDDTELVTSFSAGTTGLTPNTPTTGDIVLAGTLATTNGGTGLTTIGTADQFLSVNAGATGLEYKTVAAGTGISVTPGANVLTIANTGVTSFTQTVPSFLQISGATAATGAVNAPITLATQSANTVFAGPTSGGAATPTFRALVLDDLSGALQLYTENASTPTAPVASGTNAVAIGSGATATAEGSFAEGAGTDARIFGQKAFANGSFATAGDAQHGIYLSRIITTDDTPDVEMFLDGVSTQLVMPANSVFVFDIFVAGRRTDATGGGAGYRFVGVAKRDTTAASVTFVGSPSKTVIGETDGAWDANVSVDTATGAFYVRVRGQNGKTIRWVSTITTTEVTN